MAEASRMNFFIHSSATILNVQLFREATILPIRHYHYSPQSVREMILSSRHATFALILAALLNFLELKYQGKAESPFETCPKTMFVSITSLLLYCLSYDAKLRLFIITTENTQGMYQSLTCVGMTIFGPLSLASISSVLFPDFPSPFLYLAAILYSLSQIPRSEIKRAWNWLRATIQNKFSTDQNHHRRRRSRIVSGVRVPWLFPQQPMIGRADLLPPV